MLMTRIEAYSPRQAEQYLFLSWMADEYNRKNEGWRVEMVDTLPPVIHAKEKVYLGSSGHTYTKSKIKYLVRGQAINLGYGWMSPSQAVRDWLTLTYPKRRARMNRHQKAALVTRRPSPPLFAVPDASGAGVYLDLQSAYWSILRRIGWNVEYMPGRFLGRAGDVYTFPAHENKLARNTLVSVGLPGSVPIWTGEKFSTERIGSSYINLLLWGAVMHILNGVAADMVKAGAVYVMTDGYIIPYKNLPLAYEVFDSWGLPFSVKGMGVYHVKGAGCYRIGDKVSKSYDRRKPHGQDKIVSVDTAWLRPRVRWASEHIEPLLFPSGKIDAIMV